MRAGAIGVPSRLALERWVRIVLGAALALTAAELVTRRFYDLHYTYDPELGYLHAPGEARSTTEGPPAISTWTTGGLRRKGPPDDTRSRILAVGDSFTEAVMINDGDVFTDRLEAALPQYQFLNVGRPGLSAADYTAFAPVYERRFHPTWTIIEVSPGDLTNEAFEPRGVSRFTLSSDGSLEVHAGFSPRKTGPLYWIRDRSMFAHLLWLRYGVFLHGLQQQQPLFRAAMSPPPASPPRREYPIEAVMDATATAYGERVTFALLASYIPEAPMESPADERRIAEHCATRGYSCVSTRIGYQQFADEGRAPYGFATNGFNEGHLNEAGHALLARILATELKRLHALL